MIIIPIGLCFSLCRDQQREQQRHRRQTVTITQTTGPPNTGPVQPTAGPNSEIWSGYFVDGNGTSFPMALWLNFDQQRCQFNGGGQESGHNFSIEEGWLRNQISVSFTKVVAGHRASYTGTLQGERMSGSWFLPGYNQTGGSFLLERR